MAEGFIEQQRRQQIVGAAVECLAELGFARTSFAQIAERVSISPALISYHFHDKATMLTVVVDSIIDDINAALTSEVGDAADHCVALDRLIRAQVRYFASHPNQIRALGQIADNATGSVAEKMRELRTRSIRDVSQLFSEGQAAGDFRSFDARPVAISLLATFEGFVAELFENPAVDVDAYGHELSTAFVAAVRA
jgi:AcrR family transcriptional regulator